MSLTEGGNLGVSLDIFDSVELCNGADNIIALENTITSDTNSPQMLDLDFESADGGIGEVGGSETSSKKIQLDISKISKETVSKHNFNSIGTLSMPCYVIDISNISKKEAITFSIISNIMSDNGDINVYFKTKDRLLSVGKVMACNTRLLMYYIKAMFVGSKVYTSFGGKFKEYTELDVSVIKLELC